MEFKIIGDEEIAAIKPTLEESDAIYQQSESYQPSEFKGFFYNDEVLKLTKRKIAKAQAKDCERQLEEYLKGLTPEGLREEIAKLVKCYYFHGYEDIYRADKTADQILSLFAYYQSRQLVDRVEEVRLLLANAPMNCTDGGDYSLCRAVLEDEEGLAKQICQLFQEGEKG